MVPVPKEAPLKVLIVEDNLVNQKVLAKQLQNKGCEVHLANHGGEAIDTLMKSWFWKGLESTGIQIDVVLMDMEMPIMDGLTATKKIRELEKDNKLVSHVPVISVTANARAEQVLSTQEAGVVRTVAPKAASSDCVLLIGFPGRHHVETFPDSRADSEDQESGGQVHAKG